MATSRSCIMFEKQLWNSFLLYLLVGILQLVHEMSSFPEVLYKRGVLKNFSKSTDKYKKQWSGGVLSKDVLENFTNFIGENLCWSLSLIKLQFLGMANLLRKTPTRVISCEICKLFKYKYFEEHLWVSASKLYLERDSNTDVFLWILWITQEHLRTPIRGSSNNWF